MGIYLNPGNENFRRVIARGDYVDKTGLITEINRFIDTGNTYVCMSRPRRFGKTIAGNMLSAYYSRGCDSRELFAPYMIAMDPDFSNPNGRRNSQNVIKIDMNSEYQNTADSDRLIDIISAKIKKELKREFPVVEIEDNYTLAESILEIHASLGETFIVIIDEYDVLVRERADAGLFQEYLRFLNGLFKSDTLRPAINLAYLTGILPVVRDKIQSKLNNFEEYTMLDAFDLTQYIGFTSDEVKKMCDDADMDFEECRRWYDGYAQNGYEIYNPESVIKSMRRKSYDSYWGKTSTYEAIAERIRQNFEGTKDAVIKMLAGESVEVEASRYMNTMDSFRTKDDFLTYLIHLGYLAYNDRNRTCRIPNWEIRKEWYFAIEADPEYTETNKIIEASKELLSETIQGNTKAVEEALDITHIHVTSNRSYNNEDALGSAIYLAYIYALNQYYIFREITAGKGFADMVFIPFKNGCPAMVIELKRNDSAESGLAQIKEKKYYDCMSGFTGEMLLVGVNYDEKKKTHTCAIEKFVKDIQYNHW